MFDIIRLTIVNMNKSKNIEKRLDNQKEATSMEPSLDIWDPKLIEEEFLEFEESGLKDLEGLDDSQQVILHDFPSEGKLYTVGEIKQLIVTARNKDNSFTFGIPRPFIIESTNPDKYFRENFEQLERRKKFTLDKLAPYPNDLLITYVHPNHYIDFSTSKPIYYQKTAGELKAWVNDMDWEDADQILSHAGGIKIISSNPDISMEELQQHTEDNSRMFSGMIQRIVDQVNHDVAFREKLIETIKDLPDDAMISYPLKDGSMLPELSVKELRIRIGVSSQDFNK